MSDAVMTTNEVAKAIGVKIDTLQSWVRKGLLQPVSHGEGKQRRHRWSEADLDQARQLAQEGGLSEVQRLIVDTLGTAIAANLVRAAAQPAGPNEMVAVCEQGIRIVQRTITINEMRRRMRGAIVLIPAE